MKKIMTVFGTRPVAIRRMLDEKPDCKAVYPINMNPVVRQAADEELRGCEQMHIIEPMEYLF